MKILSASIFVLMVAISMSYVTTAHAAGPTEADCAKIKFLSAEKTVMSEAGNSRANTATCIGVLKETPEYPDGTEATLKPILDFCCQNTAPSTVTATPCPANNDSSGTTGAPVVDQKTDATPAGSAPR
ncbi:MAG: hypothetical protein ISR65_05870 [Bacteriovoracaceae bacterium]|nr:hypothetical protein [Bacteriovoracaceae bacterium]